MGDLHRNYFGLQFHPEVHHTPAGATILQRFVSEVCHANSDWTTESIIARSIQNIRCQVGKETILSAVSGGVDSSVATAIVQQAVGDQLVAVFVDTGMLRQGEAAQVQAALRGASPESKLGIELITVNAVDRFMHALQGVTAPEEKRRIIGEQFIRIFEEQARLLGSPRFLVQGTIYPDVVESSAQGGASPNRSKAQRIKTHHNVGGTLALFI
jgi:GMP synthase (glutamine-hydrolysing)